MTDVGSGLCTRIGSALVRSLHADGERPDALFIGPLDCGGAGLAAAAAAPEPDEGRSLRMRLQLMPA